MINCKQIDIPKLKIRPFDIRNINNFFEKGQSLFDEKYFLHNWKSFNLVNNGKDSPILSKFDSIKIWKTKLNRNDEIYSQSKLVELSEDCDGILSSILDPIDPNMNSDEFLDLLQKNIYEEIEKII